MRTIILLILICIFGIFSCDKNDSKDDKAIALSSLKFTNCLTNTKSTDGNNASIRLIGQATDKLLVKMINTEFCCGTDSITIIKKIVDTNLTFEIIDNGPHTHCFCPHNLEFEISSLKINENYSLNILESEHSYYRDTFNVTIKYSSNLDTIINID